MNERSQNTQTSSETRTNSPSATVVQIDTGKYMQLVSFLSALCGIAAAMSVWAAYTARDAATEARMAEYYLMDPHYRTPDELRAWSKFREEHQ